MFIFKKIFILILIFISPSFLLALFITLDSNIVKEGDIIRVKIINDKLLNAAEIEFLNKTCPIFFNKYDINNKQFVYSALVPVPLKCNGKYTLIIKIMIKNLIIEKNEKILVKKIKSKSSSVYTGKFNKEFLDNIAKQTNIINNLQNQMISAKFTFPFIMPVDGIITTDFGVERIYDSGKARWQHKGIDIYAQKGTPVKATNNGIVAGAYYSDVQGNFVVINHGAGVYSLYFHLQKVYIKKNQIVLKNDIIGTVGDTGLATGPHLHWQMNILKIPINPKAFLSN